MRSLLFFASTLVLAATTGCYVPGAEYAVSDAQVAVSAPGPMPCDEGQLGAGPEAIPGPAKVPVAYFVQAGASFWPAELIARLPDGSAAMRFTSKGADDKGVVEPERLFVALLDRSPARDGEQLFVEWQGSYWPATVVSGGGGLARIHYDGYGPEWDETVGPERTKRLVLAR